MHYRACNKAFLFNISAINHPCRIIAYFFSQKIRPCILHKDKGDPFSITARTTITTTARIMKVEAESDLSTNTFDSSS